MSAGERSPLAKLSAKEQDILRMLRWKCRTDLGYLCREVLGYPDVSDTVHGKLMDCLQKFPKPSKEQFYEHDKISYGNWFYYPLQKMTSLPGGRRVLILDSRGFLKSSINAKAHTIQWILNYPDMAVMILQSTLEKAEMVVGEIKRHFQYNENFRLLFPEHCPQKSIDDFGTKAKFTTCARSRQITRSEETVSGLSITAGTAGIHVDVIKFSDIVEPSNVGTPEQMEIVTTGFYQAHNLLVGPNYWIDVEGTRYDFGDCYGKIIKTEKSKPEHLKTWKIYVRGCYVKDTGDKEPEYTPEELELPNKKDKDGLFIPTWLAPERGFDYTHFEEKRVDNAYLFSSQMENRPRGGIGGREVFPVEQGKYPALITRKDFTQNVRISHYIATVDTAETNNERSNYTAITIAGFASDGRVYVNEIIHGKFLPHETAALICALPKLDRNEDNSAFNYGPKLQAIHIEETGFIRGMMIALKNYEQTTGNFLPIKLIKRDNRIAKIERIQNSLQPYYMSKNIVFLDDIKPWNHLIDELRQFPKSESDDILDSLADIFQGKTWFGREVAKPSFNQFKSQAMNRMLGVENPFSSDTAFEDGSVVTKMDKYYDRTGGL